MEFDAASYNGGCNEIDTLTPHEWLVESKAISEIYQHLSYPPQIPHGGPPLVHAGENTGKNMMLRTGQ